MLIGNSRLNHDSLRENRLEQRVRLFFGESVLFWGGPVLSCYSGTTVRNSFYCNKPLLFFSCFIGTKQYHGKSERRWYRDHLWSDCYGQR